MMHSPSDGGPQGPLDLFEKAHILQAQLCNQLELIADGLPVNVDPLICGSVIEFLRIDMPLHHRDEELGLFPLIERRALPADNIHDILARLALEHATDESFAAELLESLELLRDRRRLSNPEMVGYMLRSFFESYRRHIAWENAIVIPLARQRLTEIDLAHLSKVVARHRR